MIRGRMLWLRWVIASRLTWDLGWKTPRILICLSYWTYVIQPAFWPKFPNFLSFLHQFELLCIKSLLSWLAQTIACHMKPNWSGVNLLNSTEKNRKKHFDLLSKPEFDYSLATVWLHALSMVGYIYTFWFNLVFIRLILGCGICGFFFLWLATSCFLGVTKWVLKE